MITDTLLKERKKSSKQEDKGWQNSVKGPDFFPVGNVELIAREADIEIPINTPLLHLCPLILRTVIVHLNSSENRFHPRTFRSQLVPLSYPT